MGLLHIIRLASLGTVLVFSIVVLGLSANIEALAHGFDVPWAALPLAVSILTLFAMVPVLVLEHLFKGGITSRLFVEVAWVGLLWVLWLAAGAEAASFGVDASQCSRTSGVFMTECSSIVAITAFSFLNWLILLGWFGTLLVFGAMGNHWNSSVPDTDLTKKNASATGPGPNMAAAPGAAPYGSYPPQQAPQHGYPQQQAQGYQGHPQQGVHQQGVPQQSYPGSPMSGPVQHPGTPGHTPGAVPV